MGRLSTKVALITGAGAGMGRAHAELMASEGARIIATDIDQAAVEATCAAIVGRGGEALALQHDVAQESQWTQVVQSGIDRFGKIDILVNNAGVLLSKSLQETTVEEWDRLFSVNVRGVFLGCKSVLPGMQLAGGGSIVNISSIYGLIGAAGSAAYQASKGRGAVDDQGGGGRSASLQHPGQLGPSRRHPHQHDQGGTGQPRGDGPHLQGHSAGSTGGAAGGVSGGAVPRQR
jgi:NADP-dependent 3-hydroxy acid dehydrogenase YdfG